MRKTTRAPRRRQYRRRRMPMYRRMGGHVIEKAGASYATNSAPLFPNASVYAFRNFSLAGASSRVIQVAQAYQFYRIKRITWELRPAYDTFQAASSGTPTSVPHLYWTIDKEAVFTGNTSLQTLKGAGCKPIRLDDKLIRKSFKPAVLQLVSEQPASEALTSGVVGTKKISPWLPTNANAYVQTTPPENWVASSVDHLGILFAVDQDAGINSSSAPVAYVSFKVEFEFKKPLDVLNTGSAPMTIVKLETLAPQYVPPSEPKVV